MARYFIDIPNENRDAVVNSFAAQHRYQELVENPDFDADPDNQPRMISNPESKEDFLTRKLSEFVSSSAIAYDTKVAASEARENARRSFNVNISRGRQ